MGENNERYLELKQKGKARVKIICSIISAILLILLLFCVYNNYLKKQKVENQTNDYTESNENQTNDYIEENKTITLDINSGKVLNLYQLVNNYDYNLDFKSYLKDNYKNSITVDEISYEDKFKMSINLANKDNYKCDDLINDISKKYDLNNISCGNDEYNYYDKEKQKFINSSESFVYTDIYYIDEIKSKMHQIFGKDYFENKDVINEMGFDYYFINKLNGYIIIKTQTGGISPSRKTSLVSATLENNNIILTEKNIYNDNTLDSKDYVFIYKYIFKYNQSDDSYYFDKFEQELEK